MNSLHFDRIPSTRYVPTILLPEFIPESIEEPYRVHFPCPPSRLLAENAMQPTAKIKLSGLLRHMAQKTAMHVAQCDQARRLSFSVIETEEEWDKVRALRHRVYKRESAYMLDELSVDVTDDYDGHSLVFAAWWDGIAVATVRLTGYPFESESFVGRQKLDEILGDSWPSRYLEWGRLLVDRYQPVQRLSTALVLYAQMRIVCETSYREYVGYSRAKQRRFFTSSGFRLHEDKYRFQIPKRGSQDYFLLKGNFLNDLAVRAPRITRLIHLLDKMAAVQDKLEGNISAALRAGG